MKKLIIAGISAGILTLGVAGVNAAINEVDGINFNTGDPGTGIVGTAHDLSSATGRGATYGDLLNPDPYDRICVFCHAPHNTIKTTSTSVDYLPLWNHDITTMISYNMYDNGADDPTDTSHKDTSAGMAGPGSVSLLCLSCHDGSVAVNAYGSTTGNSDSTGDADAFITQNAQYVIGGSSDMIGDLSNHHPIGFNYGTVATADNEIAATTASMGSYTIGDLLWAGNMECTTCHDVHNSRNTGEKFLWVSDTNSDFCLTCHLK